MHFNHDFDRTYGTLFCIILSVLTVDSSNAKTVFYQRNISKLKVLDSERKAGLWKSALPSYLCHNKRNFPWIDHSASSARIVLEQNKPSKKVISHRNWALNPRTVVLTSCVCNLMPSYLSYLGKCQLKEL